MVGWLIPWGHLAMSGDTLDCHTGAGCYWRLMGQVQGCCPHPTCARQKLPTNLCSVPEVRLLRGRSLALLGTDPRARGCPGTGGSPLHHTPPPLFLPIRTSRRCCVPFLNYPPFSTLKPLRKILSVEGCSEKQDSLSCLFIFN